MTRSEQRMYTVPLGVYREGDVQKQEVEMKRLTLQVP